VSRYRRRRHGALHPLPPRRSSDLRCIEIAAENPADQGEFRVFNQFTESFSVQDLAEKTRDAAKGLGLDAKVANIENPRVEKEDHYYNAVNTNLIDLGLEPHLLTQDVLKEILHEALEHKDSIIVDNVLPTVTWK